MGTVGYDDVAQSVGRFEEILTGYGIHIAVGSELERICHDLLRLDDIMTRKEAKPNSDIRSFFADAMGVYDIVYRVVASRTHPSFSNLLPHLRLLNKANPSQATPTVVHDQSQTKLFELFVALVLMRIGTNVRLDDPLKSSGGRNPDVLGTFNGHEWGFACKTVFSKAPRTLYEAFAKGCDQITKSAADLGVVIFSLKNLIPIERIWRTLDGSPGGDDDPRKYVTYPTVVAADLVMAEVVSRFAEDFRTGASDDEWRTLLNSHKRVVPALLFSWNVAAPVSTANGPTPTIVRTLRVGRVLEVGKRGRVLFKAMNKAIGLDC